MHRAGDGGGPAPRSRRPAGDSRGGQFAACRHDDQQGRLEGTADGPDRRARNEQAERDVLAACDPATGPEEMTRLLAPGMPAHVRLAAFVSCACPRLSASAAAGDPEPAVRALAVLSPHLDPDSRLRLAGDPAVLRAAALIAGDDPVAA